MNNIVSINQLAKLGVEVYGLDLAQPIDSHVATLLRENFNNFHLIVIKDQCMTEKQLIHVSQIFGEAVPALVPTYRLENYPVITKHTNVKNENNLSIGVVAPEYVFHSDSYFTVNPSKATLLYSLKAPLSGGETHFVDMCVAYETLDSAIKEFIHNKNAIYKNAYINQPPVSHPLVRAHPVTNKKALFVNIHRALGIEQMDQQDALKLLEKLYNHAIAPDLIYKHKWQKGDLLIWNNPTTMHCATGIEDTEERLLYRILTKGDYPVT